ncbi:hypothetical protein BDF21DRAFT_457139 [Thamnidium elegans]|nr:hypothetical protein BDF21DRAFT_457139 [Thamnidium elegans]
MILPLGGAVLLKNVRIFADIELRILVLTQYTFVSSQEEASLTFTSALLESPQRADRCECSEHQAASSHNNTSISEDFNFEAVENPEEDSIKFLDTIRIWVYGNICSLMDDILFTSSQTFLSLTKKRPYYSVRVLHIENLILTNGCINNLRINLLFELLF